MALASTRSNTQRQHDLMIVDAQTSMPPNVIRMAAGILGQRMRTRRRRSMISIDRSRSKITYAGTGNESQFSYDALGRNVRIVEIVGGSTTSTKQFVWSGFNRRELRDAIGNLVSQFFLGGEYSNGITYFYTRDHVGSVKEMSHMSSGALILDSQLSYDPYGALAHIAGSGISPSFTFAGLYEHRRSQLLFAAFRPYSSSAGRFITRDRYEQPNLYWYGNDNPICILDPLGLNGISGVMGAPTGTGLINGTNSIGGRMAAGGILAGTFAYGLLIQAWRQAIENLKDTAQQGKDGQDCISDYAKKLECCNQTAHEGMRNDCYLVAYKELLQCLAKAGFNHHDVEPEAQFQDQAMREAGRQLREELDALEKKLKELF